MNILVYIRLVVCSAWGHSASLARTIIFYVLVITGTAILLVPIFDMTIDAAGLLGLLSNPKFYAILFGSIVLARLVCAPYWIWQDDQKTIAALRGNHNAERRNNNIAKLREFFVAVGPIIDRSLPQEISEDDFNKYAEEADTWVIHCANWIGENMGDPACQRFLQTGMSDERIIGAVNESHSNVILNLTRYRTNLLALIESDDAWDKKN